MKPNFFKTITVACLISIASVVAQAQSAPAEVTKAAIARDITSAATVKVALATMIYG